MLDVQKQASAYFLDYNLVVPALPAAKIEWKYGLNDFGDDSVKICPNTLRPFYYVNGKRWDEVAYEKFKVDAENLFKRNKYFEAFV